MYLDLEGVLGVPDGFPRCLCQGGSRLLYCDVMDPRDNTCNFDRSWSSQYNHVGAHPDWLDWLLLPVLNPYHVPRLMRVDPVA